jgi:diacylglycerol kinase family enzyme
MAVQLFTKQLDKNNKIRYYQSKSVIIKRKFSGMMHVDGDPVPVGKRIQLKVIASGLNVIVPAKEDRQKPIQAQILDIQSFFREISRWIGDIRP